MPLGQQAVFFTAERPRSAPSSNAFMSTCPELPPPGGGLSAQNEACRCGTIPFAAKCSVSAERHFLHRNTSNRNLSAA
eukprot:15476283-Alexandrium_andersonii.AAC.1